jgi:3-hydroxyisobutyrate dehydrogenase
MTTPIDKIAWIGTGKMGSFMCLHVINEGFSVTVHNRTRERAAPLIEKGALWADSPASAAKDADIVFSMVGMPAEVREIALGPTGVLAVARPGAVYIDMTTSDPGLAHTIYEHARARDIAAVDAPVSGGDIGARDATLSIMIGGDPTTVDRVRPLLELMGKIIVHQGGPGAGQHTKMVNQILIATGMIGVCEGLLYAYRAGLDLETVLRSVSGGAAGSWSLSNYAPRMLRGDFDPGFAVEHFLKDVEIALDEARRLGLALPGLALAHELYVSVRAYEGKRRGVQALLLGLARLSNIHWDYSTAGVDMPRDPSS